MVLLLDFTSSLMLSPMSSQGWLMLWFFSHNNQPRYKDLQYVQQQKLNEIFILLQCTSCSLCCSHACKSCRVSPRSAGSGQRQTGQVYCSGCSKLWGGLSHRGRCICFPLLAAQDSHPGVLLRQFTVYESSPLFGVVFLNFFF